MRHELPPPGFVHPKGSVFPSPLCRAEILAYKLQAAHNISWRCPMFSKAISSSGQFICKGCIYFWKLPSSSLHCHRNKKTKKNTTTTTKNQIFSILLSGLRKTEPTFGNVGCDAKKDWGSWQGCKEIRTLLGRWVFGLDWHCPISTRNRNSCLVPAVKTLASHLLALGPWAQVKCSSQRQHRPKYL